MNPPNLYYRKERKSKGSKPPGVMDVLRSQWKNMLVFISILMSHTLSNYLILGFFATYLSRFIGLDKSDVAMAIFISQMVLIFSTLFHGYLNDLIGRKRIMLIGCVLVVPAIFFSFLIAQQATLISAIVATVIPVLIFPMITSGVNIGLVDMFPAEMRATAGSMAYNVGTALFGGTAPLIATWLVTTTGSPFAVVGYVAGVALVSFISISLFFHYKPQHKSGVNQGWVEGL